MRIDSNPIAHPTRGRWKQNIGYDGLRRRRAPRLHLAKRDTCAGALAGALTHRPPPAAPAARRSPPVQFQWDTARSLVKNLKLQRQVEKPELEKDYEYIEDNVQLAESEHDELVKNFETPHSCERESASHNITR
ncbi:hypothetical protein EVAR_34559_1 [Eumeta japonica]|uniref:Uncharacterized protein n=1 Tax=Eumeta variegata TaxID=151549 RepID=A0A4C1X8K0_EUMVA|nr:hypothetical protein EVAR_34559_1 [Eumeta japonica]